VLPADTSAPVVGQVQAKRDKAEAAGGTGTAGMARNGGGTGTGYSAAAAAAMPVALATSSELAKQLEPLLNSEGGAKSLEHVRPRPQDA
jgi:hypothetical protein